MARREKKAKSAGGSLVELVGIVIVALGLALGIQAFLIKPYKIPSESMVPTLEIGQRVLVNRVANNFTDPKRGDVVVFKAPVEAQSNACAAPPPAGLPCVTPSTRKGPETFIKRVVGLEGDRLKIENGKVVRNGKPEDNPAAQRCESGDCTFTNEIRVPKGHLWLMGDNRGASSDSRVWGPVPRDWIIGEAFSTYWPPKRIGLL